MDYLEQLEKDMTINDFLDQMETTKTIGTKFDWALFKKKIKELQQESKNNKIKNQKEIIRLRKAIIGYRSTVCHKRTSSKTWRKLAISKTETIRRLKIKHKNEISKIKNTLKSMI